jgi:hypothetical protein
LENKLFRKTIPRPLFREQTTEANATTPKVVPNSRLGKDAGFMEEDDDNFYIQRYVSNGQVYDQLSGNKYWYDMKAFIEFSHSNTTRALLSYNDKTQDSSRYLSEALIRYVND